MYEITMPPGGQTTDESVICKWHKKPGDRVERGDVLFEIETDKTTLEVESFCAGHLRLIKCGEGDTAATGEVVAYIGEMGEQIPEAANPTVGSADTSPFRGGLERNFLASPERGGGPPQRWWGFASPLAKKIAADYGVELRDIAPGEVSGVIKKRDVVGHIERLAKTKKEAAASYGTVTIEADVGLWLPYLGRLNDYFGGGRKKVEFADIAAKCVSCASEKFPQFKSVFEEENIEIGQAREKAVSVNREILSRDMAEITVYYNRRETKRAVAEQFLAEVQKFLDSPELLTLKLAK